MSQKHPKSTCNEANSLIRLGFPYTSPSFTIRTRPDFLEFAVTLRSLHHRMLFHDSVYVCHRLLRVQSHHRRRRRRSWLSHLYLQSFRTMNRLLQ